MIIYLIKSTLCMAIFYVAYKAFLEGEKMHHFNRYYLLVSVIASFVIPLITVGTVMIEPETISVEMASISGVGMAQAMEQFDWWPFLYNGLFLLYATISMAFLIRFIYHIRALLIIVKRTNNLIRKAKCTYVLLEEEVLPHTFLNYIFLSRSSYERGEIQTEIFTHEERHATAHHSFDILFLELLIVFFWFNPLLRLYKKAIQLNHEFIADQAVVQQHSRIPNYQNMLLHVAQFPNAYYLASNINFEVTKKRLKMMTQKTAKKKLILYKLSTFILVLGVAFFLGNRIEAQSTTTMSKTDKVNAEKFYKNAKIYYHTSDGNQVVKKYSALGEDIKAKLPPPPPMPSGAKHKVEPLPKGSMVHLNKNGSVKIMDKNGNWGSPAPPPPPPHAPHAPKAASPQAHHSAPSPPSPPSPPTGITPAVSTVLEVANVSNLPAPPPPPPPPPPASIEDLAREGAIFMKDGKEISSKEALKLSEDKNSSYSIYMRKTDNGTPLVKFETNKKE